MERVPDHRIDELVMHEMQESDERLITLDEARALGKAATRDAVIIDLDAYRAARRPDYGDEPA